MGQFGHGLEELHNLRVLFGGQTVQPLNNLLGGHVGRGVDFLVDDDGGHTLSNGLGGFVDGVNLQTLGEEGKTGVTHLDFDFVVDVNQVTVTFELLDLDRIDIDFVGTV